MNFLNPWFLAGALAVAGPVVFHLIRRAARERMPFGSLMFLQPTPPRTVRRRKLEHPWLLFLRCLCLVLIATGFARPFFLKVQTPPAPAEQSRQFVLLLDTSASMRRAGIWAKAREIADKYLRQASPSDQVAVMTFDQQPRAVVSLAEWSAWAVDQREEMAHQRLAAISPGWMGTHLGVALTTAAEQFQTASADGPTEQSRFVVLITDLQEGAKLDGLQGHVWPKDLRVVLERVEGDRLSNAGLELLEQSSEAVAAEDGVRVRVSNSSDSRKRNSA